jgi:hypothetical protein
MEPEERMSFARLYQEVACLGVPAVGKRQVDADRARSARSC